MIDDVFSELDVKRRLNLMSFLTSGNQVIFTMINERESLMGDLGPSSVFKVNNGTIVES